MKFLEAYLVVALIADLEIAVVGCTKTFLFGKALQAENRSVKYCVTSRGSFLPRHHQISRKSADHVGTYDSASTGLTTEFREILRDLNFTMFQLLGQDITL